MMGGRELGLWCEGGREGRRRRGGGEWEDCFRDVWIVVVGYNLL